MHVVMIWDSSCLELWFRVSKPACGQAKETMKELQSKEMNLTMNKALLTFFSPVFFLCSEKIVAIGLLLSQPHYFCNGGNKPGICTLKHKCWKVADKRGLNGGEKQGRRLSTSSMADVSECEWCLQGLWCDLLTYVHQIQRPVLFKTSFACTRACLIDEKGYHSLK